MKQLRRLTATAALALALVVPGSALASVSSFEIGTNATLGPEGATVTLPVTVNCDDYYGYGWVSITVSQASGHRLTQGTGYATVPCTGSDETVDIQVGNFPGVNTYKKGKATATGTVVTSDGSSTAGPQEIQINK